MKKKYFIITISLIVYSAIFGVTLSYSNNNSQSGSYDTIVKYSWPESCTDCFDEETYESYGKTQLTTNARGERIRYVVAGKKTNRIIKNRKNLKRKKLVKRKKTRKRIRPRTRRGKNYITYRVHKRDNLFRISKRFGVSVKTICSFNKIGNKNSIYAGMSLRIPRNRVQKKSKRINRRNKNKRTIARKNRKNIRKNNRKKSPKFIWPIRKIVNIRREQVSGVKSIGITIKGYPRSPIVSSATGVVKRVGYMRGYGNYIVVKHKNRYATVYANLGTVLVHEGDKVGSGKIIGRIDKQNRSIHFQIDHEGRPANPLRLLPKKG